MTKFYKDEVVEGCVTGIEKYGIFVTLDEYYSGLIHISEISDGFVRDINKVADIGETIRVRVIDTDDDTFHVKLSIKNLNYRLVKKKNTNIRETEHGFNTLENQLTTWIRDREI
jgi:predicted RNA-binding protein with RPS1 domain